METFAFKAATQAGQVIEGEREAPSKAALIDELHKGGYIPIRIGSPGEARASDLLRFRPGTERLPLGAIALFFKEMATLIGAGVSADRAVGLTARTAKTERLHKALSSTREALRGGASFSRAVRTSIPGVPPSALSLIEAGEATGKLAEAFAAIAHMIDAQLALRRSLVSALIYPSILVATSIGAILFLLAFVLPQFKSVFADAGASLPLATVILIAIGEAIKNYGIVVLCAALAGALLFLNWRRTPPGRAAVDAFFLRLPMIGTLLRRIEIARLARTLSALLAARVPLSRALSLTANAITNLAVKDGFEIAARRAKEGEPLAPALGAAGGWPSDAIELITIGEESGRLDLMLANLADLYEADLKTRTERFLAMLTPALTLVMGALVAAIIGAVMSAILGAYNLPM